MIGRTLAPIAFDPAARRVATTWLGRGLLFVATVLLLEHARPVLLPVTIAIVFTFVLAQPVRALRRAGVHEYLGAGLVIAAVLGAVAIILMLVAAPAAAWWSRAPLIVQELIEALQGWRDALFPYATPEPLSRPPAAGAAPIRWASGWRAKAGPSPGSRSAGRSRSRSRRRRPSSCSTSCSRRNTG